MKRGLEAEHFAATGLEVGEAMPIAPVHATPLGGALGVPLGLEQLVKRREAEWAVARTSSRGEPQCSRC